jgi:hypothetical protein
MAAALERRAEPRIYNFIGRVCIRCSAPETKDIGVVVQAGPSGTESIVAQGRPDTFDFIGGDAHTDTGIAYQYSGIALTGADRFTYFKGDIGIVHRIFSKRTTVFRIMSDRKSVV